MDCARIRDNKTKAHARERERGGVGGESEERNREKEITFKGMGVAALFSSNLCELLYIEKRRRAVVIGWKCRK